MIEQRELPGMPQKPFEEDERLKHKVTVFLDDNDYLWLTETAYAEGISLSQCMREAWREHVYKAVGPTE